MSIHRIADHNITVKIIFTSILLTGATWIGGAGESLVAFLILDPAAVLQGQVWRLVTFPMIPPGFNILVFFAIYLFMIMGRTLEAHWGTFRFNIYLLIGYLATIAVAFLLPGANGTVSFLGGSVFLAFAWLYPDFELLLFFILPVKIKYLALIQWIGYAFMVIVGDWRIRLFAIASVINFLLFFGADVFYRMRAGKRRMERRSRQIQEAAKPFHECTICGVTDKMDRRMEFRVCSRCEGMREYCTAHLKDHQHIGAATDESTPEK